MKDPYNAPEPPSKLAIVSGTKHAVELTWKAPESDGGNYLRAQLISSSR